MATDSAVQQYFLTEARFLLAAKRLSFECQKAHQFPCITRPMVSFVEAYTRLEAIYTQQTRIINISPMLTGLLLTKCMHSITSYILTILWSTNSLDASNDSLKE